MKKFNKFELDKLLIDWLTKIITWFNINKFRIFTFMLLSLIWITAANLPYLNFVFRKNLVIFLIFINLIFIFKLTWKLILYFCFGLFLISYLLTSFGSLHQAELVGNYIYGFLVIVSIKFFASI